jgi:enamine deaminase RidA (YjgF/YER057c/UK114 family)
MLRRWFVSDAANHRELHDEAFLHGGSGPAAVSIVQQPPINGTKAALWCWFVESAQTVALGDGLVALQRPAYCHLMAAGLHSRAEGEYAQTEDVLRRYNEALERRGLTLADDVVRTWIFVQGVDTHYADMVSARREFFAAHGLTPQTHFIASTGIEGKYIHPEVTVFTDIYAVSGLRPGQMSYLKGSSHLNPTHEYGVTFERATAIDYGDRRHVFVSGTASIDNRGQIVFPFDVARQTDRVLENIEVLLREGGVTMADVAQMIVYMRDMADYGTVSARLDKLCGDIPRVVVWAPVCRPGWLVEIECIAVADVVNDVWAPF